MAKAILQAALGILLGAVLVLAASVRAAEAQIPTHGIFYACLQPERGDGGEGRDRDEGEARVERDDDSARLVRLVAEQEPCRPGERRVKWNAQGPAGPQGPQGPTGAQGPAGLQGVAGPEGPAGPSAAFKQVAVAPFAATAAAESVGSVVFTVPAAGTALVMGTGLCALSAPAAVALEVGAEITVSNPTLSNALQSQAWLSSAPGEQPAYRSLALSRTFTLPSAGTYQVFLNEERASAAGAATCYVALSTFFTATQLP